MSKKNNRLLSAGIFLVFIPIIILSFSFNEEKPGETDYQNEPLYTVTRGDLSIKVTENGSIASSQSVLIESKVRGTKNVIWVVEEGKKVKKGDLLVELDSQSLVDYKEEYEDYVSNAELAEIQAKQDLEINKKQGEADLKDAQMNLDFAKQDYQKYMEGQYIQDLRTYNANITLAKAQLETATNRLGWSKKLNKEGYVTDTELQADELTVQREKIKLESAEGALKLFENFTHKKTEAQMKRLIERREFELEKTKHKIGSTIYAYKARLTSREVDLKRKREKLEYYKEQIELCKIRAPQDGLVVYNSSMQNNSGKRSNGEPLAAGVSVKEREDLIHLPKSNRMLAVIRIPETSLNKVKKGQEVDLVIDALNGKQLTGKIKQIDPMPNPHSIWMNPDLKEYNSEIVINEEIKGLRPGMSCKVEINIKDFEDTIYVPVQCVVRENEQSVVYVMTQHGPEKREVETGLDNDIMVRILDGIEEGEKILTSPPLDETGKPETAKLDNETESE
ncbi:MAG: efflux RND transporter periplasmic adaptor subunit [Lentisphaeraceae bacterium]|nr:efflux RND transporter periplasmic adaptor subunit [Lentisphaeraceae bacterium]